MTDLVFWEPNKIDAVPFTTSDIIAESTKISYRSIQRTIERQLHRLEAFGRVRFEITPFQTKGGVQDHKIYFLNEEQATLLITFLKNNDIVADFKVELVRQFYAMRRELLQRRVERAKLLPSRRDMTDAIRDCVPDSPHKSMWYKHYTDLAYRAAFGKSAAQLRKERNVPQKAIATDYMTADELSAVERITKQIGVLVEMRLDYGQIKAMLLNPALREAAS